MAALAVSEEGLARDSRMGGREGENLQSGLQDERIQLLEDGRVLSTAKHHCGFEQCWGSDHALLRIRDRTQINLAIRLRTQYRNQCG